MIVEQLNEAEAIAFRELRLTALKLHPDAFGSSWEEEIARPLTWFATTLREGCVVGAKLDEELLGIAGLRRADGLKTRHRATLWGMYVSPTARRQGIGAGLVRFVIEKARDQVEDLNLTVAAHNRDAISLYEAFGFVIDGVDKRALKVEGVYIDEVLMRLAF